jgi:demethylmenaquinone methyltransferase/2-methoxy-6-polyprenyl-1,4-benzoquinol methylase
VSAPGASPSPRVLHARRLFAGITPGYDAMGEILSFGQNRRWRGFLVSSVPAGPRSRILDVATGTAAVAIDLCRGGGPRVVGLDQSEPMLLSGRERIRRAGCDGRISLLLGQAERLPFGDRSFDAVTFTYLLRYVDDPPATVAELARVLRPGGVMASLEFHVPSNPVWRVGWQLQTWVVLPLFGLLASRGWFEAGRFLGPSISGFARRYPLREQVEMWRRAGLTDVRTRTLSLGAAVVMRGVKA